MEPWFIKRDHVRCNYFLKPAPDFGCRTYSSLITTYLIKLQNLGGLPVRQLFNTVPGKSVIGGKYSVFDQSSNQFFTAWVSGQLR